MRRVLVASMAALLAVGGGLIPAPVTEVPALQAVSPVEPVGPRATGVSYCPWALADDSHDTLLSFVSLLPATVSLSFPSGGEVGERVEFEVVGLGSAPVALSGVRLRGASPSVVEFSAGPAAAAALTSSPGVLAGDLCPDSIPKVWQLPGGSTREGEQLTLRLFNPFPEDAKLSITGNSEFGVEAPPQFEGVAVASRGWRDLDLSNLLTFRDQLALTIASSQGLVIPVLILDGGSDRAIWPGTGQGQTWEFPLVRAGGLRPVLAVRNPGTRDVDLEIDLFEPGGPTPGAMSQEVAAGGELRIPLEGMASGAFGLRVRADGAISAVVLGEGEQGRAATPGAVRRARRWLVPGVGVEGPARYDLWLLNSGSDPLTVSISALSQEGPVSIVDKVSVPPGTIRQVPISPGGGVAGLMVEALAPFSVAWSTEAEGAVAYGSASPLDE